MGNGSHASGIYSTNSGKFETHKYLGIGTGLNGMHSSHINPVHYSSQNGGRYIEGKYSNVLNPGQSYTGPGGSRLAGEVGSLGRNHGNHANHATSTIGKNNSGVSSNNQNFLDSFNSRLDQIIGK